MRPTGHQLLVREMILQLKKGVLDVPYFANKFNTDIVDDWRAVWEAYAEDGLVELRGDRIELTREGLLRVDGLLPAFFEPQHQGVRYT
ncbi:MAG: hypothetical protein VB875_11055 [Pirellulales bacterium]